jgi:hypothetical protein
MFIQFFEKMCIFKNNETIVYGQVKDKEHLVCNYPIYKCNNRPDFYIKIPGFIKNTKIKMKYKNNVVMFDLTFTFPFENCHLNLDPNSAIISTMCKNYGHRLDEWIQYNLKLGFSAIIIFNNDLNNSKLNEPLDNCIMNEDTYTICSKYKQVFVIDCPYSAFEGHTWDNIQRITLSIGVNAFKDKCKHIALIDADEFIYQSQSPKINIETYLKNINTSIILSSNIMTNKKYDIINNNVLQIAKYVGKDDIKKVILYTPQIKPFEFIIQPHGYPNALYIKKRAMMFFHIHLNKRYKYEKGMPYFDQLIA